MLLNEEQIDALIRAALESNLGPHEIEKIVRWAERARLDYTLLGLVLKGTVQPTIKDGEVAFYFNKQEEPLNLQDEEFPDIIL